MASENGIADYPETDDFYSLLALQRDPPPTDAQIRSAYRRLSRSFHPDKQTPELRDAAARQYERIRVAHDTLIDPQKRVVYDMLGEEGVREEWNAGGVMGTQGEAEKQEVGVKAMDAVQFKHWFLMTMKKRERKAMEDMVQAKSLIRLQLDARPMFFPQETTDPDAPALKPTSFAVGLNFTTPFQLFGWLRTHSPYGVPDDSEEEENESSTTPETADEREDLRIHATVGGQLEPMAQKIIMANRDTGEEESRIINAPPALFARNVSLGARLQSSVRGVGPNGTAMNRVLFPILGDSFVQLGVFALPEPYIQATMNKSITLVKNTSPLSLGIQASVVESPLRFPPTLSVSASRNITSSSLMYGSWTSGTLSWPRFIESVFALAVKPTPEDEISQITRARSSNFELGFYTITAKRGKDETTSESAEEEEEDEEDEPFGTEEDSAEVRTKGEPLQSWGVTIQNSPMDLRLSVTYVRKLFAEKTERPKLSEWNLEGHHPNKKTQDDRSVRLQVKTSVDADLSFSWTVTGTRRFGEFTHIGLGVGIEGQMGLVVSLTWRRLGQSIKLPVALCPLEYARDIAPLAVIVPWLTFSAVEFGFLRPRQRRKRQQLLSQQSKNLKKAAAKRKNESLEAVDLMRDQVKRRQAKEFAKDGLVILYAEYGHDGSPSDRKSSRSEPENASQMADVTIPLAALVDQSQLVIPSKVAKSQILGFYDPAPLLPKVLRVRYRFGGKEHFVEVNDSEGLTCPMRSHMM